MYMYTHANTKHYFVFSGETLGQVQNWLKKQSVSSMETVECGGQSLDSPQIAALEKAISEMKVFVLHMCSRTQFLIQQYAGKIGTLFQQCGGKGGTQFHFIHLLYGTWFHSHTK